MQILAGARLNAFASSVTAQTVVVKSKCNLNILKNWKYERVFWIRNRTLVRYDIFDISVRYIKNININDISYQSAVLSLLWLFRDLSLVAKKRVLGSSAHASAIAHSSALSDSRRAHSSCSLGSSFKLGYCNIHYKGYGNSIPYVQKRRSKQHETL